MEQIPIWSPAEYSEPLGLSFRPTLAPYLHPDAARRPCILVVPGGAYCFVSPTEAEPIARAFYDLGFQALVLTYSTNPTFLAPLGTLALRDLSRAVRLIRARADEYRVDPDRLFLCGFSAGGHLCASLCVHYADIADPDPALDAYANRPDGAILSYPVITSGLFTHQDSMLALLGPEPAEEALDYAALERHVTEDTPPCFLWHTLTDGSVPVENSLAFAKACRAHGVPFALHLFSDGPHGLSTADRAWLEESPKHTDTLAQMREILPLVAGGALKPPKMGEILSTFLQYPDDPIRDGFLRDSVPMPEIAPWPGLAAAWIQSLGKG